MVTKNKITTSIWDDIFKVCHLHSSPPLNLSFSVLTQRKYMFDFTIHTESKLNLLGN